MRKVGLGIPFLDDTCRLCNGHLDLKSTVGLGTRLSAEMEYDHVIDRPPLGDMAITLMVLHVLTPRHRIHIPPYCG
ncbi:MAG: hypothetical protein ACLR23_07400 [Clostridia bacterium]